MAELKEGDKAPYFKGLNQDGIEISLDKFKDKRLILYFYPKDDTPGCTAEACNFNDNIDMLRGKGFDVVGVSKDTAAKHLKFIARYDLSFNLIADTEHIIMENYGTWREQKMFGKKYMGTVRTTFIISAEGIIEKIFSKVDTKKHIEQIFKELQI